MGWEHLRWVVFVTAWDVLTSSSVQTWSDEMDGSWTDESMMDGWSKGGYSEIDYKSLFRAHHGNHCDSEMWPFPMSLSLAPGRGRGAVCSGSCCFDSFRLAFDSLTLVAFHFG